MEDLLQSIRDNSCKKEDKIFFLSGIFKFIPKYTWSFIFYFQNIYPYMCKKVLEMA